MRPARRLVRRHSAQAASRYVVELGDRPVAEGFSPAHLIRIPRRFPTLRDPPLAPARGLDLPSTELVLGVVVGDEARAYPLPLLREAHVVNDRIAGQRLLVAFCGKCRSGVAFDPTVDGRSLCFDLFAYYQGNLVLRDDQTDTLWASLTGEALAGPLVGRRLDPVPLETTTLEQWVRSYPDGLAPSVDHGRRRVGGQLGAWVSRSVSRWDGRVDPRALVLGVRASGAARAYVLEESPPGPRLFEDDLGGVPIVLMARPGGWPLAYDRRLDGRVLRFRTELQDVVDDTGSVWTAGRAIAGPLRGARLAFVPSQVAEWYTWAAHHEATELAWPVRQGSSAPERSPGD